MQSSIRAHALSLALDDETWAALEAKAAARRAEVAAYAVELYLEHEGFTPAWAAAPLGARFPLSPSSGSRRRAR